MDDEKLKQLSELLYDIEVEWTEIGEKKFPVFELVRKEGGPVRDDKVDSRNPAADIGFNSKDHNFVPTIVSMGLGDLLYERVKSAYEKA